MNTKKLYAVRVRITLVEERILYFDTKEKAENVIYERIGDPYLVELHSPFEINYRDGATLRELVDDNLYACELYIIGF